jgi:hypothetical protein
MEKYVDGAAASFVGAIPFPCMKEAWRTKL